MKIKFQTPVSYIIISLFFESCAFYSISPTQDKYGIWSGYKEGCPAVSITSTDFPDNPLPLNDRSRNALLYFGKIPKQFGYVVLKSGDTLRGSIANGGFHYTFLPLWTESQSGNSTIRIDNRKIKKIRVYNDSIENNECNYTDYLSLRFSYDGRHPFYNRLNRILGLRNNVFVCDNITYWSDSTATVNSMYLIKDSNVIAHFRIAGIRKPDNSTLHFINHRYHQHFKRNDFKTIREMLNYILDKENELEKTKSISFN